jgi:hypothetical protein
MFVDSTFNPNFEIDPFVIGTMQISHAVPNKLPEMREPPSWRRKIKLVQALLILRRSEGAVEFLKFS